MELVATFHNSSGFADARGQPIILVHGLRLPAYVRRVVDRTRAFVIGRTGFLGRQLVARRPIRGADQRNVRAAVCQTDAALNNGVEGTSTFMAAKIAR